MRRLDNEHGAVAVFVAIMLVIAFAMAALVIEIGQLYWERRQLQNGADAAALALAADCAEGIVDCATASIPMLGSVAEPYADDNAHDGASAVPTNMPHGTDPANCEPGGGTATNPLTDGTSLVKVTTRTVDANNSDNPYVTHLFAPLAAALLGEPATETTAVRACAVAGWGEYPGELSTIPLTISLCEYDPDETTTYPGPHRNPAAPKEPLVFHQGTGGANEDTCDAQAGHDADGDDSLPAGFGWLDNDGKCNIVTNVVDGEEWIDKAEGNDPECDGSELEPLLDTVVQIPVFNDFCRPPHDDPPECPDYSNKDKYRIETYASFYLDGYRFPATKGGDHKSCKASQACIVGYFTESASLGGGVGGGPKGGVILVELKD